MLPSPAPDARVTGWTFGRTQTGLFRKPQLSAANKKNKTMAAFPQAAVGTILNDVFRDEYQKYIDKQPVRI